MADAAMTFSRISVSPLMDEMAFGHFFTKVLILHDTLGPQGLWYRKVP